MNLLAVLNPCTSLTWDFYFQLPHFAVNASNLFGQYFNRFWVPYYSYTGGVPGSVHMVIKTHPLTTSEFSAADISIYTPRSNASFVRGKLPEWMNLFLPITRTPSLTKAFFGDSFSREYFWSTEVHQVAQVKKRMLWFITSLVSEALKILCIIVKRQSVVSASHLNARDLLLYKNVWPDRWIIPEIAYKAMLKSVSKVLSKDK